jgi:hypothetical protein
MFGDPVRAKAVLAALFGYLLISLVAMAVIVYVWMPAGVIAPQELSRLAEADPHLLFWQDLLGTVLGILAGFAACHFSGAKGLSNSLILGLLLTLYGVVGILMHPTHPIAMQVAKLVSPVPLVLLGGWLRLACGGRGKVTPAEQRARADSSISGGSGR